MAIFPNLRNTLRRGNKKQQTATAATGRKSMSLQINNNKEAPASTPRGVFLSTRTFGTITPPSSVATSISRTSSNITPPTSPMPSWKSSGDKGHHRNTPLIVSNPDKQRDDDDDAADASTTFDEALELGMAMARSKNLPGMWYYSSNHIMVNKERTKRAAAPLTRMRALDELARDHAQAMANEHRLHHIPTEELAYALQNVAHRRLGSNVYKGENIRNMHDDMMDDLANRNNIVDRRFTHMGMGTAMGANGELYLCQIFRG